MMINSNTKVKVRSLDEDIDFFDIVAGVLQGDTLVPYLFIICLDYELRTSIKENGLTLKEARSRRYSAENITDANYADDIALLANTPTLAESLLHSLEQAAGGIGLHVNANKSEYKCFNQGDISTVNGGSLILVDKLTYLGSSVSSTECDTNMRLVKVWTAIDRLSIIYKSDLYYKIKNTISSKKMLCQFYCMDALNGHWQNLMRKSQTGRAQECYKPNWTNPGSNIPRNKNCMATYFLSLKPSK